MLQEAISYIGLMMKMMTTLAIKCECLDSHRLLTGQWHQQTLTDKSYTNPALMRFPKNMSVRYHFLDCHHSSPVTQDASYRRRTTHL